MKSPNKILLCIAAAIMAMVIGINAYQQTQPYYEKYNLIAHALGGIDGKDYTNSKEALRLSYQEGLRLIEVDLSYTSDGHLVARHNWKNDMGDGFSSENIPDFNTFMESKIYGTYTTVSIEDILQFAMEHPDVYFITDIKPREISLVEMLQEIENIAEEMGYHNLEKQFIVQFYSYDDYTQIRDQFSFQNYIFTLYRMKSELKENGIDNILNFCIENGIEVITIPKKYVTDDICQKLGENGITVLVNTIDDEEKWQELKKMGVSGIFTNYLVPETKISKLETIQRILLIILALLIVALLINIVDRGKKIKIK